MNINLIVFRSENGVIGNKGAIPWYLEPQLEILTQYIGERSVLMGRVTADSLLQPFNDKPHLVVSGNRSYRKDDFDIVPSIDEGFSYLKELNTTDCIVIGGGSIFRQSVDYCSRLYVFTLLQTFAGDTFFPLNSVEKFAKTDSLLYNSNINFTFDTYLRNDN